jgi:hypothetical protein
MSSVERPRGPFDDLRRALRPGKAVLRHEMNHAGEPQAVPAFARVARHDGSSTTLTAKKVIAASGANHLEFNFPNAAIHSEPVPQKGAENITATK